MTLRASSLSVLLAGAIGIGAVVSVDVAAAPLAGGPTGAEKADLVSDLMAWQGDVHVAISDVIAVGDVTSLSLTEVVPLFRVSLALQTGTVTTSLEDEVLAWEGHYLIRLTRDGDVIGEMFAATSPSGGWSQVHTYDQACAEALAALEEGDRVIRDMTGSGEEFMVVRGDEVSGLEECSYGSPPDVSSLGEYQQYMMALAVTDPDMVGGAGPLQSEHAERSRGSGGGGVLVGAVACGSVIAIGLAVWQRARRLGGAR